MKMQIWLCIKVNDVSVQLHIWNTCTYETILNVPKETRILNGSLLAHVDVCLEL